MDKINELLNEAMKIDKEVNGEKETEKREGELMEEEKCLKLCELRRKNWTLEDYIEYHDDMVFHTYDEACLDECIKDEEEE